LFLLGRPFYRTITVTILQENINENHEFPMQQLL